jgi:hypothetical protein
VVELYITNQKIFFKKKEEYDSMIDDYSAILSIRNNFYTVDRNAIL